MNWNTVFKIVDFTFAQVPIVGTSGEYLDTSDIAAIVASTNPKEWEALGQEVATNSLLPEAYLTRVIGLVAKFEHQRLIGKIHSQYKYFKQGRGLEMGTAQGVTRDHLEYQGSRSVRTAS